MATIEDHKKRVKRLFKDASETYPNVEIQDVTQGDTPDNLIVHLTYDGEAHPLRMYTDALEKYPEDETGINDAIIIDWILDRLEELKEGR